MGRHPCCDKIGLKRGPWTIDEDQKLINFILNNGMQCWRLVPKLAGGPRSLHISPAVLITRSRTIGTLESSIKKRLKLLGLDPVTHKPIEWPSKNCDTKVDCAPSSNPREEQKQKNKALKGATTSGDHDHKDFCAASMKQEGSELGLGLGLDLDETSTLLHGYGMLWESLDMEDMKPQTNIASNSGITSFSLENTLFPFMGEASSPLLECSKLYWEDTMDSFIL